MRFLEFTTTAACIVFWLTISTLPASSSDISTVQELRNNGRVAEAIALAESLRPDPHALYLLSKLYALPGKTKNIAKAQNLERLAKRQGFDPVAQGLEKPIIVDEGLQAFQDARLLINQRTGNAAEIRALLEVAASHNNYEGKTLLAHWLMAGIGGQKDTKRGMTLLIDTGDSIVRQAVQGDAVAQYTMGQRYKNFVSGYRVYPENIELAMIWYGRAAAQGHPDALSDLGWAILVAASDNPVLVNTLNGKSLEAAEGILILAREQGSKNADRRLARVQTLRARKESRDVMVGIAVGVLAAMAYAASNAPDDVTPPQITWQRDNCVGMNGLGWVSTSAGNAAAIFGGCSRY